MTKLSRLLEQLHQTLSDSPAGAEAEKGGPNYAPRHRFFRQLGTSARCSVPNQALVNAPLK
jgi:hypothetical protein